MIDSQLFVNVKGALDAWFASRAVVCEVRQGFQPTAQGAPSNPFLSFFKVAERRYGHVERREAYNPETQVFDRIEGNIIEATLQFNAGCPITAGVLNAWSPGDFLKSAARGLQSDDGLAYLRARGVGILRIQDIRNPIVQDDKMRHTPQPSFDAIFTHIDTEAFQTPALTAREIQIHRV